MQAFAAAIGATPSLASVTRWVAGWVAASWLCRGPTRTVCLLTARTYVVQQAVHVDVEMVHLDLLKRHIGLLVVLVEPRVEARDPHAAAVAAAAAKVPLLLLGLVRGGHPIARAACMLKRRYKYVYETTQKDDC